VRVIYLNSDLIDINSQVVREKNPQLEEFNYVSAYPFILHRDTQRKNLKR